MGRGVTIRGANVGGGTKMPAIDGYSQIETSLDDGRNISFVGRPFPLEEAPAHFARLRSWGFVVCRFLVRNVHCALEWLVWLSDYVVADHMGRSRA